jgi:hypothetical protein
MIPSSLYRPASAGFFITYGHSAKQNGMTRVVPTATHWQQKMSKPSGKVADRKESVRQQQKIVALLLVRPPENTE